MASFFPWLALAQNLPTEEDLKKPALPRGTLQARRAAEGTPATSVPMEAPVPTRPRVANALNAAATMGLGLSDMDGVSNGSPARLLTPEESARRMRDALTNDLPVTGDEVKGGSVYTDRDTRTEVYGVPDAVYNPLRNRLIENPPPAMHELNKRGDDLAGVLTALQGVAKDKYQEFDFSPLLGLAKSQFGSKLGDNYVSPRKEALELGQLGTNLSQVLGNMTGKLSDSEETFLSNNLKNKYVVGNDEKIFGNKRSVSGTLANSSLDDIVKALIIASKPGSANPNAKTPEERREEKQDAANMRLPSSEPAKAVKAATSLKKALSTYMGLVEAAGDMPELVGEAKQTIDTAHANLVTAVGDAANLGVLSPGDVTRLEKALPKYTGFSGLMAYGLGGGLAGMKGAAKVYSDKADTGFEDNYGILQKSFKNADPELIQQYYDNYYKEGTAPKKGGTVEARIWVKNAATGERALIPLDDLAEARKEGFEKEEK